MVRVSSRGLRIVRQLAKFGASGGLTVAADYSTFALLHTIGAPLLLATVLSLLAGFVVSFTLNRQWVFNAGAGKGQKGVRKQLVLYAALFIVNTATAYLMIDFLQRSGLSAYIAKIISMIFITAWNFFIYKKIIFRPKLETPEQDA
jgi:putative flippase GtrA